MNIEEIILSIEQQISQSDKNTIIEFNEETLSYLNQENAIQLIRTFGSSLLIKLPPKEIAFFEWLKAEHGNIWVDLWETQDSEMKYIVSLSFLPLLLDPVRGFPICDLRSNNNYYFTPAHLIGNEITFFVEAVKERFLQKESLTIAQLLALEISMSPIDIWRFSYHHGLDIIAVKKAVEQLKEDSMLMHCMSHEELAEYVEFLY